MEKNRENLNNPNQDLTQDLNSILGLDTQLNTNNLIRYRGRSYGRSRLF